MKREGEVGGGPEASSKHSQPAIAAAAAAGPSGPW